MYWGRLVLLPVALAALLTFVLNPIVYGLRRMGTGSVTSVIPAVCLAGTGITVIGFAGSRQVTALLAELPANTSRMAAKVKSLREMFSNPAARRFEHMIEEIGSELQDSADDAVEETVKVPDPSTDEEAVPVVLKSDPLPWMLLTGYFGSAVEVLATRPFTRVVFIT